MESMKPKHKMKTTTLIVAGILIVLAALYYISAWRALSNSTNQTIINKITSNNINNTKPKNLTNKNSSSKTQSVNNTNLKNSSANTTTYLSSVYKFSFRYPSGFNVTSSSGNASTSKNSSIPLFTVILKRSSHAAQVWRAYFQTVSINVYNSSTALFSNVTGYSRITIGGIQGWTITKKDSDVFHEGFVTAGSYLYDFRTDTTTGFNVTDPFQSLISSVNFTG